MHTRQWQQLNEDAVRLFDEQVAAAEREMADFLVKTPYVLLLSVTGINVVSASRLAGGSWADRGTMPRPAPSTGDTGLYPSRISKRRGQPCRRQPLSGSAIGGSAEPPCWWPKT